MVSSQQTAPGVNAAFFAAGLSALGAAYFWPHQGIEWPASALGALFAASTALSAAMGARALARDIRLQKTKRDSEKAGTDYGSAREATEAEMEAFGMFDPSSGPFVGTKYGRAVFVPTKKAPFIGIEGPPGSGKDVNLVTGSVLHHSLLGMSVFNIDVKLETGPMLIPGLRKAGIEVWPINPTNQFMDSCGCVEINPLQPLIDAVCAEGDKRLEAIGRAIEFAELALPDGKADSGKLYFIGGSRRILRFKALQLALINPAGCTIAEMRKELNDVNAFMRSVKIVATEFEKFTDDPVTAELVSEAKNLLARHKTNPENMGSFLEWATQALSSFNQAGFLAEYGLKSTQKISALSNRPITAFSMTPHSHASEFGLLNSLTLSNLLYAFKRNPRKQRLHIIANEALQYRINNFASELEVMRGLGVTGEFYYQSYAGLERLYGPETARAVTDYMDAKIFVGINSYERAKYVSDMLSDETIVGKSYSHASKPTEININTSRHARRLMTPDEILAMPRDRAWVFVKGLRPFQVQLVHYGQVHPWRDMVGPSLEGPPLRDKVLVNIDYPEHQK